jgi:hypothetical protein
MGIHSSLFRGFIEVENVHRGSNGGTGGGRAAYERQEKSPEGKPQKNKWQDDFRLVITGSGLKGAIASLPLSRVNRIRPTLFHRRSLVGEERIWRKQSRLEFCEMGTHGGSVTVRRGISLYSVITARPTHCIVKAFSRCHLISMPRAV